MAVTDQIYSEIDSEIGSEIGKFNRGPIGTIATC